jgi:hypothetical protein
MVKRLRETAEGALCKTRLYEFARLVHKLQSTLKHTSLTNPKTKKCACFRVKGPQPGAKPDMYLHLLKHVSSQRYSCCDQDADLKQYDQECLGHVM